MQVRQPVARVRLRQLILLDIILIVNCFFVVAEPTIFSMD